MTFTIHDVEQRTPEWAALRAGRLCASRAHDMLATIKTGEAAARRNLRVQLVLERLTGKSQERGFVTAAMQAGIDREPDAVALYDAITGTVTWPVGFVSHPDLLAGYSPDGVVGDWTGVIEVKSPLPATHLDFLKSGVIPDEYQKQIRHALWITGVPWCDFVSYCPEFPDLLQCKLSRVVRDEKVITEYDRLARTFLQEVETELQSLLTMRGIMAAAAVAVA